MDNILPVYNRFNFKPVRAIDKFYLVDKDGNVCLDFVGGVASNSLGYNSKIIEDAVISQIHKGFFSQSNYFYNESAENFASLLCHLSQLDKVFFCNSGAESCETAIKVARKRYNSIHSNSKPEIICLHNAFHGRTIATISAGGRKEYMSGFRPTLEGFVHAKINDINDLASKINQNTCAVMLEVIQGEGGVIECDKLFLQQVEKICAKNSIALIIDEVQTGVGRTGKFFSYEHFNIQPDIITMAKGLSGGIPIGCCIMSEEFAQYMNHGSHGSTFGGNALATSVGLAVCKYLSKEENLKHIENVGNFLRTSLDTIALNNSKIIKSIKGKGLMIGIEINDNMKNKEIAEILLKNKLLVTTASNNTLRLLPPLNITIDIAKQACEIIEITMSQIDIFFS
jgi:acetylornithine/N-succinyldiaminopimelate aminotransferase